MQLKSASKKGQFLCASSVSDETASKHYPEQFKEFLKKKSEERKLKKQELINEDSDHFMTEKLGIVNRHHYTILSCKELSNGTKLVLLRHVWGLYQWSGPWGLNHEIWRTNAIPKEEKKLLKQLADDKMQFFIPFEDFLALFDEVSINVYQKDSVCTSGKITVARGAISVFNFKIQKAGVYSVRASQRSHQLLGLENSKNNNGQYPALTLLVVKDNQVSIKLEEAVCDARRDVFIESTFGIGTYCVYVSAKTALNLKVQSEGGESDPNLELGIVTYGPAPTIISSTSKNSDNKQIDFTSIFHECLKYQLFHQDVKDFHSVKHKELAEGDLTYIYMPASSYGFGAVFFRNSSFEKKIKIEFFGNKLGSFFSIHLTGQLQDRKCKRGIWLILFCQNQARMATLYGKLAKQV